SASPLGDSARPGSTGSTSADQMYEASLAQLRRGSTSTARIGLREMLRAFPTSARAPDALYFIGQSFAAENPDSAAAYYGQVADKYPTSPRASSALYNLGLLAERRKESAKAKDAYQRLVQQYPQSHRSGHDRLQARLPGRAGARLPDHSVAGVGLSCSGTVRPGEEGAGARPVRRQRAVSHWLGHGVPLRRAAGAPGAVQLPDRGDP